MDIRAHIKRLAITMGITAGVGILMYAIYAWMVWSTSEGGFLLYMTPFIFAAIFVAWLIVGAWMEKE